MSIQFFLFKFVSLISARRIWRILLAALVTSYAMGSAETLSTVPSNLKACEPQTGTNITTSLVGAPAVLAIGRISADSTAVGRLQIRNDGTSPVHQWCVRAHFRGYAENDVPVTISVDGQPPRSASCVSPVLPTAVGAIEDLDFSISIDPTKLPITGTVIVGATTEVESKKAGTAASSGSGQASTDKCSLNAKELAQPVVVTTGSSVPTSCRILLGSLFASGLFFLFTVSRFWNYRQKPMGASQWSFSSSAATNITYVGTIMGTVLASSALPDYPHYMTKQGYIVTSLLFSVMAGLAPVLYNFCCRPSSPSAPDSQQPDFQGTILLFLLADSLTVWAVLGELAIIAVMFGEFSARLLVPVMVQYLTWAIAIMVGCSLMVFCFRVARYYAKEHPRTTDAAKALSLAPSAFSLAPKWNAL